MIENIVNTTHLNNPDSSSLSYQVPKTSNKNTINQKSKLIPSFKSLLWNCNRLINKQTLFNTIVRSEKPDVIALSELKCNNAEARHFLAMLNHSGKSGDYEILFTTRENNPEFGGGTALLSKKGLDKTDLDLNCFNEEVSGKIIKLNGTPVAIFSWYNPPNKLLNCEFLKYIDSKYKNYLILGDLNAHLEPFSRSMDKNGEVLASFLESSQAQILNNSSDFTSYWTSNVNGNEIFSHSIIDFVIGSGLFVQNLRQYKTLRLTELDAYQNKHFHIPVLAIFNLKKNEQSVRNSQNECFDYIKADWNKFRQIQDSKIEELNKLNDPVSLAREVEDLILTSANEAIPKINKTNRISNLPAHIVSLIKIKNYWRRRYFRSKISYIKENYYTLKNLVNQEVYKFENSKMQRFIQGLGPRPLSTKPLWKRIKRMHNQSQSDEIPTLIKEGKEYQTDEAKARVFAERLSETFNEDPSAHEKFDNENFTKINDYVNNKKYENEYSTNDKRIQLIKVKEIKKAISRLNSKKSIDHSGICNKMLKKISPKLHTVLAHLFNLCLKQDTLPEGWLKSTIIMIAKKSNDKTNVSNWRPISITSCIMRLFEGIILKRLVKFFEKKHIIIESQSGFRKKRGTWDNIFFITQKAFECFNRGWSKLSIFFDVEAAFDKVWHAGLVYKMAKAKVPYTILKFIINFLNKRQFRVKVRASFSAFFPITCGVPQGARLSPTLYSFYGNDAPKRQVSNKEQTLLFADDSEYSLIFKKLNDSIKKKAQNYVTELERWAKLWRMSLAPAKCNYIVFTRTNKQFNFNLKLNGENIPKKSSIKYLGITLDERLNFNEHILKLRTDCRDRLSALKIVSHKSWCLTKDTLKQIYRSIIRSKVEYSFVMESCIQSGALQKLNVIQNTALRSIYSKKREFGNEPLLTLANEQTLLNRFKELKKRYIKKTMEFDNPIICPLIEEYKNFANGRNLAIRTPLCDIINQLEVSDHSLSPDLSNQYQNQYQHRIESDFYSSYNAGRSN